jgi:hypothetical protein
MWFLTNANPEANHPVFSIDLDRGSRFSCDEIQGWAEGVREGDDEVLPSIIYAMITVHESGYAIAFRYALYLLPGICASVCDFGCS